MSFYQARRDDSVGQADMPGIRSIGLPGPSSD